MINMSRVFPITYVQGYTAALQDVLKTVEAIQSDLKRHKRRQCAKTYKAILECMIENRVILREEPGAFVRCNDNAEGGFEVYVENQGVYKLDNFDSEEFYRKHHAMLIKSAEKAIGETSEDDV